MLGEVTHSKDRLALELIGPVATSTAAFHHVVEILALFDCEGGSRGRVLVLVVVASGSDRQW